MSLDTAGRLRLGLAANASQFWLLVAVNAFVGSMVGIERDVVSLCLRHGVPPKSWRSSGPLAAA